jgi:hypothetical protein
MRIPKPLLEDIASEKCLPFIGAGFSLNAKLPDNKTMPDWLGLTKILVSDIGSTKSKKGPDVASTYERRFGRVQLIEKVRHALHSDIAEPGNAHLALVQLPFDTIYTTNFDLLLENACGRTRKPYRSLVGELQLPFHGGPLTTNIVKMHGDLRHEEHIVINREDYDGFLEKYPVISTHLSAMLITRTALFIGYSLTDPDFNQIREVVRNRLGRFQRMSYIIQFNQSSAKTNKMLDDHLHIINFKVKENDSIDEMLAEFFKNIQEELDTTAGKKIRTRKPELFEEVSDATLNATSRAPDSSVLLSSSSNLCFVLMPFGEKFDGIYRNLIRPAVIQAGLNPLRADEMLSPGSIVEQIRSAIQQSRICIADLTGRNSNVFYELGIAQTLSKPIILLSQDLNDLPFDVRHLRIVSYTNDTKGMENSQTMLINTLQQVLGDDRIEEARQLIRAGMIRAAVAMLGVHLEHSLQTLLQQHNVSGLQSREINQRLFSMGKMVQTLNDAKIISQEDVAMLRDVITIRNRAVHDLKEPNKNQAEMFLQFMERFIQKYLR